VQKIELMDANDFVIGVVLESTSYKLKFGWNDVAQNWYMDIRTGQGETIISGIAVVPNFPLFAQGKRLGLPKGELMAVVVNQDEPENQRIGRNDFTSGKFSLVYVPKSELEAIQEASQ